jgi:hypothetical protein
MVPHTTKAPRYPSPNAPSEVRRTGQGEPQQGAGRAEGKPVSGDQQDRRLYFVCSGAGNALPCSQGDHQADQANAEQQRAQLAAAQGAVDGPLARRKLR